MAKGEVDWRAAIDMQMAMIHDLGPSLQVHIYTYTH
jgi:hypothetical protein